MHRCDIRGSLLLVCALAVGTADGGYFWGDSQGRHRQPPTLALSNVRGGGNMMSCCRGNVKREVILEEVVLFLSVHYKGKEGYYPGVVGSGKALGEWDLQRAFPMQDCGSGRWTITLRFPKKDSNYEFKYVLLPKSTGKKQSDAEDEIEPIWEEGQNRGISVTAHGQAELSTGPQIPHHLRHPHNVAPPLLDVVFKVHHTLAGPWKVVSVCGADEAVGAWNVSRALRMKAAGVADKQGLTVWQATATMPIPASTDFKFLLAESESSTKTMYAWEGGPNRHVSINREGHVTFVPDDSVLITPFTIANSAAGASSLAQLRGEPMAGNDGGHQSAASSASLQ